MWIFALAGVFEGIEVTLTVNWAEMIPGNSAITQNKARRGYVFSIRRRIFRFSIVVSQVHCGTQLTVMPIFRKGKREVQGRDYAIKCKKK